MEVNEKSNAVTGADKEVERPGFLWTSEAEARFEV